MNWITFLLLVSTTAYGAGAVPHRRTAFNFAPGGAPSKTALVAWYDFADATDADGGTYNLTAVGSPSYDFGPPSIGVSDDSPDKYWTQSSLDDAWGAYTDQSYTVAVRFLIRVTQPTTLQTVLMAHNLRTSVNFSMATSPYCTLGGVQRAMAPMTSNVWYTVIAQFNTTTDECTVWVNDIQYGPTVGTPTTGSGNFSCGGTFEGNDVELDFVACWNRLLTSDERAWFGTSTRSYADL